ncbi:LON peptidase substrate-binding domain-containing protein [Robiginitalea biformata]|uniref:ATP-dependent protease La domain protein n=1 Tax=Robiginitalea biformata (strain ATCC BAA-864 / DSM 15991 / KCTC 12146 / HTCC2501) TaxID=313596 RepID=A4CMN1_ROBBH|nr:LON peptidase substrate-binding domain-containing protein [Robiginitalea biformata]EAR14923.1 ATP-dependent protease La domain protein [Robiginitalea biformata HTCC2501]
MVLPLFPLQSVFFPGESVPLHIFEERYKQLIRDCRQEAQTFGIPVYIENTIAYGTEVQLKDIVNTYADGSMDVVCVARQVFRVVRFQPVLEGKSYPGGEIRFLDAVNDAVPVQTEAVYQACRELYELMDLPFGPVKRELFNSYTLAHKMGLSFEQEYSLLQIPGEAARLDFLLDHLRETIRVLQQLNETRERIEMNGHFRNFDPLDFKDIEPE